MPTNVPYSRLTGVCTISTAVYGTAATDIDTVLPAAWTELGPTDGAQTIKFVGGLEFFYDNDNLGPVKSVRPVAGVTVTATVVNMTPEQMAIALGQAAADVVDADLVAPAVSVRRLPLGREFAPTEYAMTIRGGAQPITNMDSPYMASYAQVYIPRGVFDGEPEIVRTKDGSPGLEFTFTALVDPNAAAGLELGYTEARDV